MHLNDDDLVLHYYGEDSAAATCGGATPCRVPHVRRRLRPPAAAPGGGRGIPSTRAPGRFRAGGLGEAPAGTHETGAGMARLVGVLPRASCARRGRRSPCDWRLSRRTSVQAACRRPPPRVVAAGTQMRERVLLADLGDHLDRSEAMLVELVSGEGGAAAISAERGRAEQLVSDNRLYRQTAAATGNRGLVTVLDELERVLVDIAASPDVVSVTDVDEVRRQIRRKRIAVQGARPVVGRAGTTTGGRAAANGPEFVAASN